MVAPPSSAATLIDAEAAAREIGNEQIVYRAGRVAKGGFKRTFQRSPS
jgi:hypothetical protein